MALVLFLVQSHASSIPHILPCFHDASSEVFFAFHPSDRKGCVSTTFFHAELPPSMTAKQASSKADGGNFGRTEDDGMDGWTSGAGKIWMAKPGAPRRHRIGHGLKAHEGGVSLRNPGAEAGPEVSFPHRYLDHPSSISLQKSDRPGGARALGCLLGLARLA